MKQRSRSKQMHGSQNLDPKTIEKANNRARSNENPPTSGLIPQSDPIIRLPSEEQTSDLLACVVIQIESVMSDRSGMPSGKMVANTTAH